MDFSVLPPPEDVEAVLETLPPPEDVAGVVGDVEEAVLMSIEPLTFYEWFDRALDMCFDTLAWVMSTPYFRFFATFCLFLVACNLCAYFVRSGRRLAR